MLGDEEVGGAGFVEQPQLPGEQWFPVDPEVGFGGSHASALAAGQNGPGERAQVHKQRLPIRGGWASVDKTNCSTSNPMKNLLKFAVVAALADLTRIHGPDVVCEAIRRGMERSHGDLTLSYLRPVVDAVAKGEPEHRPKGSARTGQPSAAYKSVNGVAEPREVPEGKW